MIVCRKKLGVQEWVYVKIKEMDKQANLEKEFFLYGLQRKSEKKRAFLQIGGGGFRYGMMGFSITHY